MTEEFDALFAEHQKLLGELQAMRNVKRQWVGLTNEETNSEAAKEEQAYGFVQGALWAEAKLKDKNNAL